MLPEKVYIRDRASTRSVSTATRLQIVAACYSDPDWQVRGDNIADLQNCLPALCFLQQPPTPVRSADGSRPIWHRHLPRNSLHGKPVRSYPVSQHHSV